MMDPYISQEQTSHILVDEKVVGEQVHLNAKILFIWVSCIVHLQVRVPTSKQYNKLWCQWVAFCPFIGVNRGNYASLLVLVDVNSAPRAGLLYRHMGFFRA